MRATRRRAKSDLPQFRLDQERFALYLTHEYGQPVGIEADRQSVLSLGITERFLDAREAEALVGPRGLTPMVYAVEDSLIVTVREEEPPALPVALRQLATSSVEARYFAGLYDETFEGCCASIEALLRYANELLPSFAALQRGERRLRRRGVLSRFGRDRRG